MTEPNEIYEIHGIDYGHLCIELESRSRFKSYDTWDGFISSILKALYEMKGEIINASKKTSKSLGRGFTQLGTDPPTDLIWSMSIIFVMRTISMLESKSQDPDRSPENRNAHIQILKRYLSLLKQLTEKKEELVIVFPYNE